ncbi:MAG: CDP-alcohol phosphatidyltransferase family protein [Dehalococcoidales bacterium]|nr:CDP-alcohol phosphatidyltransferase family protein [Dehalococcoidales bacterium]MDD5604816.1 CDP-alcohol phosphatidyltransferase family protein [Dehalococcoidales bacterium]MDX9985949.1 CDP-alcohol phosphatidyltransferase family protein [Dehalococcoidales bacterium]NLE89462.1 CDP-alcohol phosphatidyltransferase family protein [Dehalococcoidales bacterium]
MSLSAQPRLENFRRKLAGAIAGPVVRVASKTGITPDMLTWFGFIVVLSGAGLTGAGYNIAGGLVILAGAACDMFDGALARYTGKVSKFGAVLDSTLDRASEGAVLIALAYYLGVQASVPGVTLVAVTMLFSFLVSYIRSRAEGIGLELKDGVFTRSERVIVLGVGIIVNHIIIALAIVVFFSIITTVQRLILVWQKTR